MQKGDFPVRKVLVYQRVPPLHQLFSQFNRMFQFWLFPIWRFPEMVQIHNHHPFKWDFPANKPTSDWGIPMAMETTSWLRRPQWHLFQELHGQQPLQALSAAVDAGVVGHLSKQRCSKWDAMHMDELWSYALKWLVDRENHMKNIKMRMMTGGTPMDWKPPYGKSWTWADSSSPDSLGGLADLSQLRNHGQAWPRNWWPSSKSARKTW